MDGRGRCLIRRPRLPRRLCVAGAYGSTKRYKSFERLYKVNDCTVLGASGELSDYQYIKRLLEELADDDFCLDDGHHMKPHEIFSYLTRVIYNRRNKCVGVAGGMILAGVALSWLCAAE